MNKTRSCKETSALPNVGTFIEVLWHVHIPTSDDNPRCVWWKAKVTSLTLSELPDIIAIADIEYSEMAEFKAEKHSAGFLPGRKLYHIKQSDRTTSINNRRRGSRSMDAGVIRMEHLSWRSSPEGIFDDTASEKSIRSDPAIARATVRTHHRTEVDVSTTPALSRMQRPTVLSTILKDVTHMRQKHTILMNYMETLESRITLIEKRRPDREELQPIAFTILKERLVHAVESIQLYTSKKGIPKTYKEVDAMRTGAIRVRTDCNLEQFEKVAQHVHGTSRGTTNEVVFDPIYYHTQSPSAASTSFTIRFSSVIPLFDCLGIKSIGDRLEICRRRTSSRRGEAVRLLGTYRYNDINHTKPAEFNVGGSLPKEVSGDHRGGNKTLTIPTLRRETREWDMVDGRYKFPLKLINTEGAGIKDCMQGAMECFSLSWKRNSTNLKRRWSEDTRINAIQIGVLELCLPFAITNDEMTCMELNKLISDDTLIEFLSQRERNGPVPQDIEE